MCVDTILRTNFRNRRAFMPKLLAYFLLILGAGNSHAVTTYLEQLISMVREGSSQGGACVAYASMAERIFESSAPESVKIVQLEKLLEKMEKYGCL